MIESQSWPRVQMAFLVCITGAIGFLTSFMLLQAGMTTIWLRYFMSMIVVYLGFLFLLWVWAQTRDKNLSDGLDLPDLGGFRKGGCNYEGKGGDFGGDGGTIVDYVPDIDLDELAIPLIVLAAAILLAASAFLVIINAPALFAELLLDGILSASLYRRLRGLDQKHWLETAIRKTALPFTAISILLVAFGWTIQWLDPSAPSIGEFLSHRK